MFATLMVMMMMGILSNLLLHMLKNHTSPLHKAVERIFCIVVSYKAFVKCLCKVFAKML